MSISRFVLSIYTSHPSKQVQQCSGPRAINPWRLLLCKLWLCNPKFINKIISSIKVNSLFGSCRSARLKQVTVRAAEWESLQCCSPCSFFFFLFFLAAAADCKGIRKCLCLYINGSHTRFTLYSCAEWITSTQFCWGEHDGVCPNSLRKS